LTLRRGQTVEDVARLVDGDLARSLKYARVWGKSVVDGRYVGPTIRWWTVTWSSSMDDTGADPVASRRAPAAASGKHTCDGLDLSPPLRRSDPP
jgi:hypothetical protein